MAATRNIPVQLIGLPAFRETLAVANDLAAKVDAALADPEFARSAAGRHLKLALVEYRGAVATVRRRGGHGDIEHRA